MGAVYCVDERLFEEKPEIRLLDRVFKVDNRMSVFLKMSEALKAVSDRREEFLTVCRFGLGGEAAEFIDGADLSVAACQRVVVLVLAAMQGISEDEAEARFRAG